MLGGLRLVQGRNLGMVELAMSVVTVVVEVEVEVEVVEVVVVMVRAALEKEFVKVLAFSRLLLDPWHLSSISNSSHFQAVRAG
jgi:hypothetical protein